jgi:metallophosphoesterase superfamily enzyme
MGNHDILRADWYVKAGIEVIEGVLRIGEFAFVHDIEDSEEAGPYYFSGHLHPGIRINGMGKQRLQFPCFYFGSGYAILPAFGRFTGTVSIDPGVESNVFAILPQAGRERRPASIYQIQ